MTSFCFYLWDWLEACQQLSGQFYTNTIMALLLSLFISVTVRDTKHLCLYRNVLPDICSLWCCIMSVLTATRCEKQLLCYCRRSGSPSPIISPLPCLIVYRFLCIIAFLPNVCESSRCKFTIKCYLTQPKFANSSSKNMSLGVEGVEGEMRGSWTWMKLSFGLEKGLS